MPALVGPAIDPTLVAPAAVHVSAGRLAEPIPLPVVPDLEAEWVAAQRAPQIRLVLGRLGPGLTREVIGTLETAEVVQWTKDVEVLQQVTAQASASSWDPLWEAAGTLLGISSDGRPVYEWDPKGYIVWVYVDGGAVWTGVFRQPVQIGDGRVGLSAVGPSTVFSERILGRAEQVDRLGDRGSFEGADPLAGWTVPDGVTATVVTDGVRGTKCLRVIGEGWVRSPDVVLDGADGYSRTVEAGAFGKWDDAIPSGTECVIAKTRPSSVLYPGEYDKEFSFNNRGGRPDNEGGWTKAPVTAGARMAPSATAQRCWVEVKSFPGVYSFYDLVTLRQGVTTGAPPGSVQDLSWYVERILRDLHSRELGGSPTGLSTRAVNCGTTAEGMRWNHNQRTPVRDVLSMVFDRDGAPEAEITAGWNLVVSARLGADRNDIMVTARDITEPGWEIDPGARVDDFVADTGRGTGTSFVSATVNQPERAGQHRIVAIVTAPPDRPLNEVGLWAIAQARVAARLHITKEASVSWAQGSQIDVGDTVWVTDHDGLHGLSRRMRVVTMTWVPATLRVLLGLGEADGG